MTLAPRDKRAISEVRMEKAVEFLSDARAAHREGRHRTSVNRAYYAALNAARALLILEGASPETHEGAITLLSLRFVKTGLLPVDLVREFKTLLSRRTDVDYGDFDTIGPREALQSVKSAGKIVSMIDKVRKRMLADLK
ncbi:MAG: HEPN domain-containing protein [Nitrospirae bacterium]|nr:HEPN domain-containing protein [Nitrospirota bacterium]